MEKKQNQLQKQQQLSERRGSAIQNEHGLNSSTDLNAQKSADSISDTDDEIDPEQVIHSTNSVLAQYYLSTSSVLTRY